MAVFTNGTDENTYGETIPEKMVKYLKFVIGD